MRACIPSLPSGIVKLGAEWWQQRQRVLALDQPDAGSRGLGANYADCCLGPLGALPTPAAPLPSAPIVPSRPSVKRRAARQPTVSRATRRRASRRLAASRVPRRSASRRSASRRRAVRCASCSRVGCRRINSRIARVSRVSASCAPQPPHHLHQPRCAQRSPTRRSGSNRRQPPPERLGFVVGHTLALQAGAHAQHSHSQQRHNYGDSQKQQRAHDPGTCATGCDCKPQSVPPS